MVHTMSLMWFCIFVCSAFVSSSHVKQQALITTSKTNVTAFIPVGSPTVSFYISGGGGGQDMPPDDPGPPRGGFFLHGEHITLAFHTLVDFTRTIFHLADMFWDLLLSTWRFISRFAAIFCSLVGSSAPRNHGTCEGTVVYVKPPAGPLFQIKATEEDTLEFIKKEISEVTGIPRTECTIFKNNKKVRHLGQVVNGGLLEIAIPLLGGTRTKRRKTDHMAKSASHDNAHSNHATDGEEECDCGGAYPEKRSKLLSRATSSTALRKVLAMDPCCRRKCSTKFKKATFKEKRVVYFSAPARDEWIKEKLNSFQVGQEKRQFEFKVDGVHVCLKAWCRIHGIGKNTYYRELKNFRMGMEWAGLRRGRSLSDKCVCMSVWFGYYVADHSDQMPHKNERWLPFKTRKVDIFNAYTEHCEARMETYCCLQSFLNMWSKFYPHVFIKKCSLFTKCTICVRLGRKLSKTRDPLKRRAIKKEREKHDDRQMEERASYYRRREAAKRNPDQYLSLIVDGMDQAKTFLPHFVGDKSKTLKYSFGVTWTSYIILVMHFLPQEITTADLMKVHVSGVISHGHGLRCTYVDFFEYPHDSNLTLNLLLKILRRLSVDKALPPILYIQADNCYRENKNKYMLAFLDILVHMRIFREVQLSFLIVGHTHEDIDQMFSKVGDKLRHQEALTPDQLIHLMPKCNRLRGLFDIREWLKPYIINIKGHSQLGQFRFRLNKNDHDVVDMFYRKGETKYWQKMKNGMFKRARRSGKPVRPPGVPEIIPMSFENGKIDINKLRDELFPKWSPYLDNEQQRYVWQEFLKTITHANENTAELKKQSKVGAEWALTKLPKYQEETDNTGASPVVPDDVRRLLDKEQENPEITETGIHAPEPKTTSTRQPRRKLLTSKK
ncbi:uncharacterized protein [Branchiostoma lanceolatum]|uniref:uncharacterized protein n=1 Tax=Branchiostoma lanceolatum TaxID=7740 RepID=UPI0034555521